MSNIIDVNVRLFEKDLINAEKQIDGFFDENEFLVETFNDFVNAEDSFLTMTIRDAIRFIEENNNNLEVDEEERNRLKHLFYGLLTRYNLKIAIKHFIGAVNLDYINKDNKFDIDIINKQIEETKKDKKLDSEQKKFDIEQCELIKQLIRIVRKL